MVPAPELKVALYSALYGPYDWVKPIPPNLGVPAYMYTDRQVTAEKAEAQGWQPRIVNHGIATLNGEVSITAPMLAHKWWKTHPHLACPDVDISLWIDGSMEIIVDNYVERCLAALGDDDWSCVPHPARMCIFTEADYSATLVWRYDGPSIRSQAEFYRRVLGHPANYGLIATGANVRRHTPAVLELGRHWWWECIVRSHQDQVSLPALLRLAEGAVPWNANLPWHQWWRLWEHGGG